MLRKFKTNTFNHKYRKYYKFVQKPACLYLFTVIQHFSFTSSVFKMTRKCIVPQTSGLMKEKALVQSTYNQ